MSIKNTGGGDWKSLRECFLLLFLGGGEGGGGMEEIDGGGECCTVGEIEDVSGLVRWKMLQS